MKLWKTLLLLVLFIGLAVYCSVFERGEKPDHEADRQVVQLLGFKTPDDITEIAVDGGGGGFTVSKQAAPAPPAKDDKAKDKGPDKAAKPADKWELTQPAKTKGDDTQIGNYVKAVLTAKATQSYKAEDASRLPDAESGLDKPTHTLTLKGKTGKTAVLEIGAQTPNKDGYFARVKGGKKLLIFAQFFVDDNVAKKKLNDLRDKTLLALLTTDVKTITLKYPARKVELARKADGWVMSGAKEVPADASAVDSMLSTLAGTRIDEFVDEAAKDVKAYGLDQPRIEVTLGLGDKGEMGVVLGNIKPGQPDQNQQQQQPGQPPPKNDKLYLQRKGDTEVLLVASSVYDSLLKTPQDLRDKTVIALHPESVTKFEYTVDGQSVELEKGPAAAGAKDQKDGAATPATWQLKQPTPLPADTKTVEDMLNTVNLLRATAFVDEPGDLAQYGLDKPRATITVTEGGKALPALLVGKDKGDKANVYVKRADGKIVYEVRASFVKELEVKPNRLRDLVVMKLDRTKFKRIALRQKDGSVVILNATGANDWTVEKKAGDSAKKDAKDGADKPKKADPGRVAAVVTALSELHANEYVLDKASDEQLKDFGLDAAGVTVTATVTLSDGTKETIYVGQDPKGTLSAFIKRKGHEPIYKSDNGMILTDLQKKPEDFEPLPEQPNPMGGMGGMGGPPPPS